MKMKLTKLACAFGLSALMAGPAAAELVAGWDFSNLPVDGASVPASLAANYTATGTSGTLNVSGDVVASAMEPGSNETDDAGLQGGIDGNGFVTAPTFPFGTTSFSGGEYLGLTARGTASAEFDASLPAPSSSYWQLTFGARAIVNKGVASNGRTTVGISFGDTCASAASVGDVEIGAEDTAVSLFLGPTGVAGGCVVFDLDGSTNQPLIDNVALSTVPEPGMGAMLVAGALGLTGLVRRRQR